MGTSASNIIRPSLYAAMDIAGLSVKVENEKPKVVREGDSATSSVWYDACYSVVPGGTIGKFAGKGFPKLLKVIQFHAPDRLVRKAVTMWLKYQQEAIRAVAHVTTIVTQEEIDGLFTLFETVEDARGGAFTDLLGGGIGDIGSVCVPAWRTDIAVTAGTAAVSYSVKTFGISNWQSTNLPDGEHLVDGGSTLSPCVRGQLLSVVRQ